MFDEGDDYDNDISNEQEYSDDDEITDINLEEEEKQNDEDGFKILTYKNVLENIDKKPKKTIPILTKFEKAKIMGVRLQQLAYGAKPRVDTTGLRSIQEIVEKELKERKILFIIRRNLPNGTYEDWKLEEFTSIE
jgi:DNA-directed RNA polymerase I, II, and III subunit RPABC2